MPHHRAPPKAGGGPSVPPAGRAAAAKELNRTYQLDYESILAFWKTMDPAFDLASALRHRPELPSIAIDEYGDLDMSYSYFDKCSREQVRNILLVVCIHIHDELRLRFGEGNKEKLKVLAGFVRFGVCRL